MNKSIEQVKEFHELFSRPIGKIGELEPLKTRQLRIKLLFEELAELATASDCNKSMVDLCDDYLVALLDEGCATSDIPAYNDLKDGDNVDQIEELDALCDIQYVLNGKILTSGLHEIFDKSFDTVHENNMSKAHTSAVHANETLIQVVETCNVEEVQLGRFIVTNASGKVIKPWNHQKVKLTLNP